MLAVQEIEKEILSLPRKEYSDLRNWFYSQDYAQWDEQIENDTATGKLDFLLDEAKSEKQSGKLKRI